MIGTLIQDAISKALKNYAEPLGKENMDLDVLLKCLSYFLIDENRKYGYKKS